MDKTHDQIIDELCNLNAELRASVRFWKATTVIALVGLEFVFLLAWTLTGGTTP